MTRAEDIWRRKTDAEVEAAAQRLDEYTDEGKRTILAELERRRDTIHGRRALYQLAAQELALGKTTTDVEGKLIGQGVDPTTVSIVVEEVVSAKAEARLKATKARTQNGALFVAIGVVATIFSYMLASNAGGYYLVTWGAILYGLREIWLGWTESRRS